MSFLSVHCTPKFAAVGAWTCLCCGSTDGLQLCVRGPGPQIHWHENPLNLHPCAWNGSTSNGLRFQHHLCVYTPTKFTKPMVARVMPHCKHADNKAAMVDPCPSSCWQWVSYGGHALYLVHTPSCGSGHAGYLIMAKPSPLPRSVHQSLSFSTQSLWAAAVASLELGFTVMRQEPHSCTLLSSLWSSQSVPVPLSACEGGFLGEETFLLSQLTPRSADPILIPFLLPFPYPVTWGFFLQVWLYEICFQWVFCENCSTFSCISDIFAGGGELHLPLLCHLDLSDWFFF